MYKPKTSVVADQGYFTVLALRRFAEASSLLEDPVSLMLVEASPEGIELGSPGDLRIRTDIGQLWIKQSGINTRTGWVQIGTGGGGGLCGALPQGNVAGSPGNPGIAADASPCDHEHPTPVDVPVAVTGPDNLEGTSLALARADHEHRLELQVEQDGVLIGAQPALNFIGYSVTEEGANDRVNITAPPEQGAYINGLNATPTGSAATSVARFDGSLTIRGPVPEGDWIAFLTTPELGTLIKFTQPGKYQAILLCTPSFTGVAGLMIGITIDATAGMQVANPDPFLAFDPARDADFLLNEAAGSFYALKCGAPFTITPAMAADADLGVLRAHITDLFDGPPVAGTYMADEFRLAFERVGDST